MSSTLKSLKEECKLRGLRGYSKLTKLQLVEFLKRASIREQSYDFIQFLNRDIGIFIIDFLEPIDKAILLDVPCFREWTIASLSRRKEPCFDLLILARLELKQRKCKSWCKVNYKTTESEFKEMSAVLKKNPYNSRCPIQLYNLADVVRAAAKRLNLSIPDVIAWKSRQRAAAILREHGRALKPSFNLYFPLM